MVTYVLSLHLYLQSTTLGWCKCDGGQVGFGEVSWWYGDGECVCVWLMCMLVCVYKMVVKLSKVRLGCDKVLMTRLTCGR